MTEAGCSRCECCSTYFVPCYNCDEDGVEWKSDCFDDLCHGQERCIHGESNPLCRECVGKTGWWHCIGNCDDDGKHEDPEARPLTFDQACRDVANAWQELIHAVFMEPPIGPVLVKILNGLNRLIKRLSRKPDGPCRCKGKLEPPSFICPVHGRMP